MTTAATMRAWVAMTILAMAATAAAQPRETAGLITELKLGGGKVEVRAAGGPWRAAAPLQALRGGDEVRATEGATATVLLSGGRGTAKVSAASSPYVVAAPNAEGQSDKARTLVTGSMKFLASGPKEPPKAVLATRSLARPPEILAPRNSPVLPGTLTFEWLGSPSARYTVKLTSPSETVLERAGVVGVRLEYPAGAPALRPGVHYRFEVTALNQPPHASTFEVLDPARAQAVRDDLRGLEEALGAGASPTSRAVARAGYLADQGLYHDARLVVLAALAKDPDEPVLHTLLGSLYTKVGLAQQAAESFDEAHFLMTRGQ